MSINFDLWKLLAGLGIFLFGMQLIEESVKSLSGRAFRRIIRMYTNGPSAVHRQRRPGHRPAAEQFGGFADGPGLRGRWRDEHAKRHLASSWGPTSAQP